MSEHITEIDSLLGLLIEDAKRWGMAKASAERSGLSQSAHQGAVFAMQNAAIDADNRRRRILKAIDDAAPGGTDWPQENGSVVKVETVGAVTEQERKVLESFADHKPDQREAPDVELVRELESVRLADQPTICDGYVSTTEVAVIPGGLYRRVLAHLRTAPMEVASVEYRDLTGCAHALHEGCEQCICSECGTRVARGVPPNHSTTITMPIGAWRNAGSKPTACVELAHNRFRFFSGSRAVVCPFFWLPERRPECK